MRSCFGLLLVLAIFLLVFGGVALLWYLSDTAEFSRSGAHPPAAAPQPQQTPR